MTIDCSIVCMCIVCVKYTDHIDQGRDAVSGIFNRLFRQHFNSGEASILCISYPNLWAV